LAEKEDAPNHLTRATVPVPDPTVLTTQALLREITGVRELFESQLAHRHELYQSEIASLNRINVEKFAKVEQQFELVERQRVEQKQDTKQAVDAALTAQKEAVKEQTTASGLAIAKSETGTSKQLEQLAANFQTAFSGQTVSIDDVKERITRLESAKTTEATVRTDSRAGIGLWVAGLSAFVFFLGFVVTLIALIYKP
jgi:hypothetical protein